MSSPLEDLLCEQRHLQRWAREQLDAHTVATTRAAELAAHMNVPVATLRYAVVETEPSQHGAAALIRFHDADGGLLTSYTDYNVFAESGDRVPDGCRPTPGTAPGVMCPTVRRLFEVGTIDLEKACRVDPNEVCLVLADQLIDLGRCYHRVLGQN